MFTSVICSGVWIEPTVIHGPMGMTAMEVSAVTSAMIGANRYKGLLA